MTGPDPAAEAAAALDAFSPPCWYPYLVGVTLLVNAVRDLHLVSDGPSCGFFRAEQFFGTHDLASTLLDVSSRHRAVVSATHLDRLVDGRDAWFPDLLARVASAPFVPAVLAACSPVASMAGVRYAEEAEAVAAATGKPIGVVPDRSLSADWIEGFSDALASLASVLPLRGTPGEGRVALVGHFMDRNEEDHLGNVREIRRLLAELELDLVSVWPGGEPVEALTRAGEASILLALPPGRKAAGILAGRTGARVVECDLPFGPSATDRFLLAAGEACGRTGAADRAVREAEAVWAPAIKRMTLGRFLGTRWAYGGDPGLVPGILEIAALVGAETALAASWSLNPPPGPAAQGGPGPLYRIRAVPLRRLLEAEAPTLDLAIGNADFLALCPPFRPREVPGGGRSNAGRGVEIGFPSPGRHAMFDQPFLGYRGFLCLADRIADALAETRVWG
jgi:nitrogenase molybdenum-iron protein alpha/beta subunit